MSVHVEIGASDLPRTCALNDRVLVHFARQTTVLPDAVGHSGID